MKKVLALLLFVILLGANNAVAQQADRLSITPYYTSQKCQKCYSSIFRLSTTHLETATHNVCGTFDRCAY